MFTQIFTIFTLIDNQRHMRMNKMKLVEIYLVFKGTRGVISKYPSCKDGYARFTTVPLKPKLFIFFLRLLCESDLLISFS